MDLLRFNDAVHSLKVPRNDKFIHIAEFFVMYAFVAFTMINIFLC